MEFPDTHIPKEFVVRAHPRRLAEAYRKRAVAEQSEYLESEIVAAFWLMQQTGALVLHEEGKRGGIGGDDRTSRGLRLEQGNAERFVSAGQYEQFGVLVGSKEIRAREFPEPGDISSNAVAGRKVFKRRLIPEVFAGNGEVDLRDLALDCGKSLEEKI